MPRSVKEWIGRTDDSMPSQNVRLRIAARQNDACAKCRRALSDTRGNACDHIVALADGGENAEGNLQILCGDCHGTKTSAEAADRATSRSLKVKALGLAPKKRSNWPTGRDKPFKSKIGGGVVLRSTSGDARR